MNPASSGPLYVPLSVNVLPSFSRRAASEAHSDQNLLLACFPGCFTPLPVRGAPRLHVFKGGDLDFEFRADGVTQMLQFFVEQFNQGFRGKQPHVNPPLRRNLAIPAQGGLNQFPVSGPSGQSSDQGLKSVLANSLAHVYGAMSKVNRDCITRPTLSLFLRILGCAEMGAERGVHKQRSVGL